MANWLASITVSLDLPSGLSTGQVVGAMARAFNRIPQNAGTGVALRNRFVGASFAQPRDNRCDLHTFEITALFPRAVSADRIEATVAWFLAKRLAALGLPGNVSVTVDKTDAAITTIASPTPEAELNILTGVGADTSAGRFGVNGFQLDGFSAGVDAGTIT